jgi:hypothetical protein
MVNVPEFGGFVMLKVPESEYVLLLHGPGMAVNPVTPQTKEQSAEPDPPVCEKLMFPGTLAKLVSNKM